MTMTNEYTRTVSVIDNTLHVQFARLTEGNALVGVQLTVPCDEIVEAATQAHNWVSTLECVANCLVENGLSEDFVDEVLDDIDAVASEDGDLEIDGNTVQDLADAYMEGDNDTGWMYYSSTLTFNGKVAHEYKSLKHAFYSLDINAVE